MILAIFARADHPAGYGFGDTAHGYVVFVVQCEDAAAEEAVVVHLQRGVLWPDTQWGLWYGGRFDRVCRIELPTGVAGGCDSTPVSWRSIGDNRAVAAVRAEDVLALSSLPLHTA